MSQSSRPVSHVIKPEPVVEGAGVHLRRSIGTRRLDHLDPFLLLDHFESAKPADYEAGFPYHPHRGIETVTLVRKGEVKHSDSLGHKGSIDAGGSARMISPSARASWMCRKREARKSFRSDPASPLDQSGDRAPA